MAERWNAFLGIEGVKIHHEVVCIEHFEAECFERNRTTLKSGAVPTLKKDQWDQLDECFDQMCQADQDDQIASKSSTTSIAIATVDHREMGGMCERCEKKDARIEEKNIEIEQLKRELKSMQDRHEADIKEMKISLRKVKQKNYYLETVKRKLEAALKELKQQSFLDEETHETLNMLKNDDLFRVLHHGVKRAEKYSAKVRHFCLSLAAHSPRAYEFIRKTFHNHLPNLRTIRNWYLNSDISGDPGIQEQTVERLKIIAEEFEKKHGRKLICSLIYDEIHLRQQIIWSLQQLKYIGFVSYGEKPGNDQNTVAKQAIVFLLNGIDVNFEFPVAYYLIDELNMNERRDLVTKIISAVTRCGIKITNLTFDGHSANVPACELLGAKLKINLKVKNRTFKPYIINPITNERIFIIMDPCHMEKLVRNRWAACGVFFDGDGNKIEWRFIEALYNYSCSNDFRTHKLTKKHMQWQRNPMNVRLAVETFSESVASSIEYLMDQHVPEFQGARPTVDFIRKMNRLFDIFNSRHCNDQNIFKRRMCPENKRLISDFFQETTEFFKKLKVEVTFYKKVEKKGGEEGKKERIINRTEILPILHTRHRVAFNGFIIDMASLMAMFEEYVENTHIISSIPTYNLLQDPIEMMFGRIRACGGFNNNPNIQQFMGAFRKIQLNIKIDLSPNSNCRTFDMHLPENIFYSNIYFVSSRRARVTLDEQLYESQKDSILDIVGYCDYEAIEGCDNVDNVLATSHILDGTSHFMNIYIASQIEQKILKSNNFHCSGCFRVFDENEKTESIDSHLVQWKPCISTIEICKTAEKFFKLYDIRDSERSEPRYDFKVLYCLIFRSMNFSTLFPKSKFECDASHKYHFIKCIVGQYTATRATQIARQKTLELQETLVRQQYNRLVNAKGQ